MLLAGRDLPNHPRSFSKQPQGPLLIKCPCPDPSLCKFPSLQFILAPSIDFAKVPVIVSDLPATFKLQRKLFLDGQPQIFISAASVPRHCLVYLVHHRHLDYVCGGSRDNLGLVVHQVKPRSGSLVILSSLQGREVLHAPNDGVALAVCDWTCMGHPGFCQGDRRLFEPEAQAVNLFRLGLAWP